MVKLCALIVSCISSCFAQIEFLRNFTFYSDTYRVVPFIFSVVMDSAIRKDAYPIQPSETSDPVHPPDNHNKNHKQTLPRTIRALKNAKHSPNHERTLVICLDGTGKHTII